VRGRSFAFPQAPNLIFGVAEDVTELKEQELVQRAEIEQMSGWLVREAAERLRVQESLRASEELYRLLAEHSTDMITKHNRAGVFIYVSPASQDLLGYEPTELLGRNPYDLFHPDDVEIVRESHENIMRQPGVNTVSYRMQRKDAIFTWLETTAKMIHDPETKEFENIICVSRDVTKRKETEARIQLLQDQLAHAARISLLGALAKGLAHELNQPLTAIGNYLETCRNFLSDVEDVPDGAREVLTEAGAEALRAAKVIQSLRKLVKPSQAKPLPASLNDLVTEVMEICAPHRRRAEVTLELQLEPELPMVEIDAVQIQQVILNLVNNAIDSMSDSAGRRVLTVTTARRGRDRVEVTVLDTGPGCPDGDVDALFTEFRTTKPSGLGLGLAICRYIVESHGGTLTGRTREAGGLAFTFSLPFEP
jgi:PAS domain S-box-containing protein